MTSNKEGVAVTTPKRNGDGYLHFNGDYNITGKHSPAKGVYFDVETVEIDYGKIAAEVKASLKAEAEAEAQQKAAEKAKMEAAVKEALTEQQKQFDAEKKEWATRKGAPAYNTRAGKHSKTGEDVDEFMHWMKTGDNGAEKVLKYDPMIGEDGKPYREAGKALQVGSDTEGGYLAPEGFFNQIIAQRDQLSWVRNSGVMVLQTGLKNVQVPRIDTKMSKFEFTAEEAAYSDSDPIFGEVDITVFKSTRTNKFSEELLQDNQTNLEGFYAESLARAWARTESYYVAVGTGTAQPQGIFATDGGTAGLTFDSSANITADEIPELFYKLGNGYRRDAIWLTHGNTEAYLRGVRDANNWAFDLPANLNIRGDWQYETFYGGRPIYTEEGVSTMAASADVIAFGNMGFYALVEHSSLAVARNPYLYQANGQVAFFAKVRWGGAVLQAEAFQVGSMSA